MQTPEETSYQALIREIRAQCVIIVRHQNERAVQLEEPLGEFANRLDKREICKL
jgi:hypothetical protein